MASSEVETVGSNFVVKHSIEKTIGWQAKNFRVLAEESPPNKLSILDFTSPDERLGDRFCDSNCKDEVNRERETDLTYDVFELFAYVVDDNFAAPAACIGIRKKNSGNHKFL